MLRHRGNRGRRSGSESSGKESRLRNRYGLRSGVDGREERFEVRLGWMVVLRQIRLEGSKCLLRLVRRSTDLHRQRSSPDAGRLQRGDLGGEPAKDLLDESLDLSVERPSLSDDLDDGEIRLERGLSSSKRLDASVDLGDDLESAADLVFVRS